MHVSHADALALLDEFCPASRTLTQTQAQELFHLTHARLASLPHEERENPHAIGAASAVMRLFEAQDVARLALQVHGAGDLGTARAVLQGLAAEADVRERRRAEVRAEMAQRSRARAEALVATTPAQKLCKQLGVDPARRSTKTDAQNSFNLAHHQLLGLDCETKVGWVGWAAVGLRWCRALRWAGWAVRPPLLAHPCTIPACLAA